MPNIDISKYPKIQRFSSGFFGMDYALSSPKDMKHMGIPACIYEIYGSTSIGKSTLCWSLACARDPKGEISIVDIEKQDPERIQDILDQNGYEGKVSFALEETDEKTFDLAYDNIKKEELTALIIDSIGAISPISEREGEVGATNMGRRARIVSDVCRKFVYVMRFRKKSPVIFLITHVHQNIGSMGRHTSGGDVKDFMGHVKISLSVKEKFDSHKGAAVIKGYTEKNRYGLKYQEFYLVYLPETGFHKGLTAVYDCILFGLAEKSRTISMDGVSYGYLSKLFESAVERDYAVFQPFIDKLNEKRKEICSSG